MSLGLGIDRARLLDPCIQNAIRSEQEIASGLYGPGVLGSWLCILGSVLMSSITNWDGQHYGFTNDFFAALIVPIVAATQLVYEAMHGVGSAAPWHVCWAFGPLACTLAAHVTHLRHWARSATLVTVALLCTIARWLSPFSEAQGLLTQPVWIYVLDVVFACAAMRSLASCIAATHARQESSLLTKAKTAVGEYYKWLEQHTILYTLTSWTGYFCILVSRLITLNITGQVFLVLLSTRFTTTTITDPAQAVALTGGAAMFCFSIWEVVELHRASGGPTEKGILKAGVEDIA